MPPGWDGVETISRVWRVAPDLNVVVCTAYADYSWLDLVDALGATDRFVVLKKPFDPVEVQQLAFALSEKSRLTAVTKRQTDDLRLLFERLPTGLALCRIDGTLVNVNPAFAAIVGRSVEETLAFTIRDLTPEKYADDDRARLESLTRSGRCGPYEKEFVHRDGHRVPVRLSGLILERGGEPHIWTSVEDITERKRAEEKIRGLNRGLEEKIRDRTAELRKMVDLMAGRENRMADLKEQNLELQKRLEEVRRAKSEI